MSNFVHWLTIKDGHPYTVLWMRERKRSTHAQSSSHDRMPPGLWPWVWLGLWEAGTSAAALAPSPAALRLWAAGPPLRLELKLCEDWVCPTCTCTQAWPQHSWYSLNRQMEWWRDKGINPINQVVLLPNATALPNKSSKQNCSLTRSHF